MDGKNTTIELSEFTEQTTVLLKKTFPDIIINFKTEFNFPNPEYGRIIIEYSNVKDSEKLRKEIYNCFMYLCAEGTNTNMGYWFRIGGHYYQYVVINNDHDEEFQIRLKELCLKYDLENGERVDSSYSGCDIYEEYCEENGIKCNYLGELYSREGEEKPKYVLKELDRTDFSFKTLHITCKICGSQLRKDFDSPYYFCPMLMNFGGARCKNNYTLTIAQVMDDTYNKEMFDVELVVEK